MDRHELPAMAQTGVYTGAWEYRYGDSPEHGDGSFVWAEPQHNDGQWLSTKKLSNPPGRRNHHYLWLRTRLTGPSLPNAALLISEEVYQSLEGYLDGHKIAGFGPMEGAPAQRFVAKRPIYLPLGADYAGRTLTLRFQSPTWKIGFTGKPRLGGQSELLVDVVKVGFPYLLTGALFIILAIGSFVFYLLDTSKALYFFYSLMSFVMAVYMFARSPMRAFLFEEPTIWRCIECASLCLLPASNSAFLVRLFERGPLMLMRWIGWFFLVYFAVGSTLLLGKAVHLEYLLLFLLYAVGGFFSALALLAVITVWLGRTEERILATGFFWSAALALYATLQSLDFIPQAIDTRYYAAILFMLTLGVLMARRFRAFNKRLTDYSTVLQLSFSSAQDLTPGQQAQIALTELLRILRAQRGLLFLCKSDGTELELVAGRDADGTVLLDPTTHKGHDQKLVTAVLEKRRPIVRQLTPAEPAQPEAKNRRARQHAMAAPLLARGQLLGVIYLETDSVRSSFVRQDVEILLGLSSQIALTLMATRAVKLESESAQARQHIEAQGALLEAATRMARGDLQSSIVVDRSGELFPLAQALDNMRLDLQTKIAMLESSKAAVHQLNEELRFQIDQRLCRLIELAENTQAASSISTNRRTGAAGLQPGEFLDEHYQIVQFLGDGTSGSVYEVRRKIDERHFAAKVLNRRADNAVTLRFAREAQILTRLSHVNIVSIFDVAITADSSLFLVMELVGGTQLNRYRSRYGDYGFALPVLRQIAAGLQAVHEGGVVHRDLKPANVLIAESEDKSDGVLLVKLVDFGISALLPASPSSISAVPPAAPPSSNSQGEPSSRSQTSTAGGVLPGTPMYLAPELAKGRQNVGPPSDVFSFGVVAFELLSAEMPFTEPPVLSSLHGQVLSVPPLRSKCPQLPQPLLELIERCLSPEPAQRPTMKQVVSVLAMSDR